MFIIFCSKITGEKKDGTAHIKYVTIMYFFNVNIVIFYILINKLFYFSIFLTCWYPLKVVFQLVPQFLSFGRSEVPAQLTTQV